MLLNGKLELENLTSDPGSPTEGMLYYNSTDKKVKVYDGSSFSQAGRALDICWFLKTPAESGYSVFDDFGSGLGNWTVATSGGTVTTSANKMTVESSLSTSGAETASAESISLPAGKDHWFFITINGGAGGRNTAYLKGTLYFGGSSINLVFYSSGTATYSFSESTIMYIKYKGANTYDVYKGSSIILSDVVSASPEIKFDTQVSASSSSSSASIIVEQMLYADTVN